MPGCKWWVIGVVTLLLSVGIASAQPPLTLINDVLYKADGTRFDGVAFIQWRTFDASNSSPVPAQDLTIRVRYGVMRVQLTPTSNASPGAYYRVTFNSNGRTQFTEYWNVPPSTTPLRLRDVRMQGAIGGSTTPLVDSSVLITDVSGLRDELDARPVKAVGYTTGRAAFINSDGGMDAVLGNLSDCVHVDGTSGGCGSGGGGSSGPIFVDSETPAGGVDGSNTAFTLTGAPNPAISLQLFRNGIMQRAGVDYSLVSNNVAFLAGAVPQTGDVIQAYYRK
jgi:hypothetical protein